MSSQHIPLRCLTIPTLIHFNSAGCVLLTYALSVTLSKLLDSSPTQLLLTERLCTMIHPLPHHFYLSHCCHSSKIYHLAPHIATPQLLVFFIRLRHQYLITHWVLLSIVFKSLVSYQMIPTFWTALLLASYVIYPKQNPQNNTCSHPTSLWSLGKKNRFSYAFDNYLTNFNVCICKSCSWQFPPKCSLISDTPWSKE